MPASTETKLIQVRLVSPPEIRPLSDQTAGAGSTIETSFRIFPLLPFRARWTARIIEFEPNHHFVDVQDKGPFRRWQHRHEFQSEIREGIAGTIVRDKIDYDTGWGFLGRIAERLFIRRQMISTFEERQKKLPQLLSVSA